MTQSNTSASANLTSPLRSFWNDVQEFFFAPSAPHTLAIIRIATGFMIAYIHLIWMKNLESYMGPNALIDNETWKAIHSSQSMDYKWTYLAHTESMSVIWCHEILACLFGLLLACGLGTRTVCCLAWFTTLMTVHRMSGLLFGLDQVTIMLVMYLCISRSGDVLSLDAWFASRFPSLLVGRSWLSKLTGLSRTPNGADFLSGTAQAVRYHRPALCWSNTLATRLIQFHLCVIYFFGGISKLRGEMWWDGSAMWYAVASYEYQSLNMTWLGYFPVLSSIATHVTLFWEVCYFAMVWPNRTRWFAIGIAVLVHGGIALFMGMVTFGFMMIVANLAFVPPSLVRKWLTKSETTDR